jgi:uncharacterized FlaG/YvyC family protein
MADKLHKTHLSRRIFSSWRTKCEEEKAIKQDQDRERRHTEEIDEITARLNKELHSL